MQCTNWSELRKDLVRKSNMGLAGIGVRQRVHQVHEIVDFNGLTEYKK